jgi:hypothetical protein
MYHHIIITLGKSNKLSKEDPHPHVKFVELEMINFNSDVW